MPRIQKRTELANSSKSNATTSRLRRFLLLGPATMGAALAIGPGSTVSAATIGSTYGYSILWLVVGSGVFGFIFIDMGIRLGLALPNSPLQELKRQTVAPIAAFIGIAYFTMMVLFLVGSLVGTVIGLRLMFGGSSQVWAIVVSIISLLLMWSGDAFRWIEIALVSLVVVLVLAFGITAVLAQPDWTAVGNGLIPTGLPAGGDITVVLALLANAVAIDVSFYVAYTIREKGTTRAQYRDTTLTDTLTGVICQVLAVCLVLVAAAAVLQGQEVKDATSIASVLGAVVGPAGWYIFAVGIAAAGFTSVVACMAAGGTLLADGLSLGNQLRTRKVKITGSLCLLAGLIIVLVSGQAPVQFVILVNALVIFVLPLVGLVMLWFCNRSRLMGDLKNGVIRNVIATSALALVLGGAVQLWQDIFG